jgi:hypothetical protein
MSEKVNVSGSTDYLIERINESFSMRAEKRLATFIRQRSVRKWIISTDFCIKDKDRPNDSFAFVIFPAEKHLQSSSEMVKKMTKKDLKDVKVIPESIVRVLRKGKVFTVCFAIDRHRKYFSDSDDVRVGLDRSIEIMKAWENADECRSVIEDMEKFRNELNKKSLKVNLVSDIVLSALLVSYLPFMLTKCSLATDIGWMPDRDNITESFEGIVHTMYSVNTSSLCQKANLPVPKLGIMTQNNNDLWCDPFIRVADYVAGAAAAWDPPINDRVPEKIASLLTRALLTINIYFYLEWHFL